MANTKISALNTLTGANAATNDLIPIVDVSASETKSITRAELFASPPAIGSTTPAAGTFTTLTSTGNATLGDAETDSHTITGTTAFVANRTGLYRTSISNSSATTNTNQVDVRIGAGTNSHDLFVGVNSGSATNSFIDNRTSGSLLLQTAGSTQASLSTSGLFTVQNLTATGGTNLGDAEATDTHAIKGATTILSNSASAALTVTQTGAGAGLVVTGTLSATGSVTIGSFTTATKPAHAAGKIIHVTDGGAGAVFQGSAGGAWVNLG